MYTYIHTPTNTHTHAYIYVYYEPDPTVTLKPPACVRLTDRRDLYSHFLLATYFTSINVGLSVTVTKCHSSGPD